MLVWTSFWNTTSRGSPKGVYLHFGLLEGFHFGGVDDTETLLETFCTMCASLGLGVTI